MASLLVACCCWLAGCLETGRQAGLPAIEGTDCPRSAQATDLCTAPGGLPRSVLVPLYEGRASAAIDDLQSAKRCGAGIDVTLTLAGLAARRGDSDRALALYRRAATCSSAAALAAEGSAAVLLRRGRLSSALREIGNLVEQQPDAADLRLLLTNLLLLAHDVDDSVRNQARQRLGPYVDEADAVIKMTRAVRAGRWEEVVDVGAPVVKRRPPAKGADAALLVQLRWLLFRAHRELGRAEQAAEACRGLQQGFDTGSLTPGADAAELVARARILQLGSEPKPYAAFPLRLDKPPSNYGDATEYFFDEWRRALQLDKNMTQRLARIAKYDSPRWTVVAWLRQLELDNAGADATSAAARWLASHGSVRNREYAAVLRDALHDIDVRMRCAPPVYYLASLAVVNAQELDGSVEAHVRDRVAQLGEPVTSCLDEHDIPAAMAQAGRSRSAPTVMDLMSRAEQWDPADMLREWPPMPIPLPPWAGVFSDAARSEPR